MLQTFHQGTAYRPLMLFLLGFCDMINLFGKELILCLFLGSFV